MTISTRQLIKSIKNKIFRERYNVCFQLPAISILVWGSHLEPMTRFVSFLSQLRASWWGLPLWLEDGSVIYCRIASGPCQSSHSRVEVPQNSRPYFTVSSETPPTWRARSLYLYPPGTGWPSYTPGHWGPFLSPLPTRRAQNGSLVYPNSYPMGTGGLILRGWNGRSVKPITYHQLVSRSRKRVSIHLLPHKSSWHSALSAFTFIYCMQHYSCNNTQLKYHLSQPTMRVLFIILYCTTCFGL
jgi:hypothetical protein